MTTHDFWHGDMRLLEVHRKAYMRDKSYTAWVQGQYNAVSFGIVLSNAFSKDKKEQYPEWKDPVEKTIKKEISDEEFERLFRNEQIKQNSWLRNLKNSK
jgi:hypothetical protein